MTRTQTTPFGPHTPTEAEELILTPEENVHRKLGSREEKMSTFLQNFPGKKKRENVAGTLCSVRSPGFGPAFELHVHESLNKTPRLSKFQFCHFQNGNIKLCLTYLTELRKGTDTMRGR